MFVGLHIMLKITNAKVLNDKFTAVNLFQEFSRLGSNVKNGEWEKKR